MSFGLRIQDGNGKTIYDSNSYSCRVVYRQRFVYPAQPNYVASVTIPLSELGSMYMIFTEERIPYRVNGNTITTTTNAVANVATIVAISFA